jgi:hypothetical protein
MPKDPRSDVRDELQLGILAVLEKARNYNRWITSLVRPYLGDDPIELGSGLGYQTTFLLSAGVPRVTLSEPTPEAVEALEHRFAHDPRVRCRVIDIDDPPSGAHSAAYAINVLEHVADDVGALERTRSLIRTGGKVVVFVPAFAIGMSRFDREIGHHRRYTRASLRAAFLEAGLEPEVVRYVNAPGLLAWIVWMRLLRREPIDGRALGFWDRRVVPFARALEARREPPFGQSVLGVARLAS